MIGAKHLEFPHLLGDWFPINFLSFMSAVDDNAALASGNPDAHYLFVLLTLSSMAPAPPYLTRFLADVPDPNKGPVTDELKASFFHSPSICTIPTTLPRPESWTIAYLVFLPSISPQDLDCSLDAVTMLSPMNSLERSKLIRAQLSSTRDLSYPSSSSSSEPSSTGGAFARVVAEAIGGSGPILESIELL